MLEVDIEHRLADFALDIHFRAGRGLTALFGRSGAGKTSVVNAIAGLLRPRCGRIVIDGSVLLDTERGICVPTHLRRVGYVFQEGRLFPHLTCEDNIAFGLPKGAARLNRVRELLEMVGLPDLGRRSMCSKKARGSSTTKCSAKASRLFTSPPPQLVWGGTPATTQLR